MTVSPRILLAAGVLALAACDRPGLLPDIAVSTQALTFEAPAGAADPAGQALWVTNSGSGTLARPDVTISYDGAVAGWLSATVATDAVPYRVDVRAAVRGLEPGAYAATLTLASGNASSSPLQVPVTLRVPGPRFALSTVALGFDAPRGGGDPEPQMVAVTNGGRGTLPVPQVGISYVGTSGWLAAEVGGTPGAYTVTARATAAGLPSGTYAATMALGADGIDGPARTLSVTLTVPPPEVAVSAPEVKISGPTDGSDPAPVAVTITNAGGGLLEPPTAAVIFDDAGVPAWLSAEVSGTAPPYTVLLRARQSRQTTWLDNGSYGATVTLTSPNAAAPQSVRVTLSVPPPVLALTTEYVTFSNYSGCPLPGAITTTAYNVGAGRLPRPAVTIAGTASAWLEATVTSTQEPWTITFRLKGQPPVDPPTDPSGSQARSDVVISVPASGPGGGSSRTAYVSYWLALAWDPITVSIDPLQLQFRAQLGAGDPAPQRIRVLTQGGCLAPPSVTATYAPGDPAWISTDVASVGQIHDVTIRPSAAGLTGDATRNATVTLGGLPPDSGPSQVDVAITGAALAPTGSMLTTRSWYTVTALANGLALVAGGYDAYRGFIYAAEVYSPSTGQWTRTGYMRKARTEHGAALLADGRVLVAGGQTEYGIYADASCEIWSSGTWTPAGSMVQGRLRPSLVPLANGEVLITSAYEPAELYDPATGTSRLVDTALPTGGVSVGLADGRVLVASRGSSTIYDPAIDSWTASGRMNVSREYPALVLLDDGRVLAVGGNYDGVGTAELWDPVTGAWTPTATAPSDHDVTDTILLSNGKVISVSGGTGNGTFSADVDLFDPATETWTAAERLPSPRSGARPVRLSSGAVLIVGGHVTQYPGGDTTETFIW